MSAICDSSSDRPKRTPTSSCQVTESCSTTPPKTRVASASSISVRSRLAGLAGARPPISRSISRSTRAARCSAGSACPRRRSTIAVDRRLRHLSDGRRPGQLVDVDHLELDRRSAARPTGGSTRCGRTPRAHARSGAAGPARTCWDGVKSMSRTRRGRRVPALRFAGRGLPVASRPRRAPRSASSDRTSRSCCLHLPRRSDAGEQSISLPPASLHVDLAGAHVDADRPAADPPVASARTGTFAAASASRTAASLRSPMSMLEPPSENI